MPKKQLELAKQIIKHQLTGLDLTEITEKNLIEIGVSSIHDRKNILRQLRILKNSEGTTYGIVNIRYKDDKSQQLQKIRIRISDAKVKVKHILKQALETFKQKKVDISQYALIQAQNLTQRCVLSNNIQMIDLINPFKQDEFDIINTISISEASTQPNSINSPIRIHKEGMESSLERLISSPAQTIYVQPMDDNDELVQLNTSGSESQMNLKTSRQTHRKNSKSSSKQAQSMMKGNKKQRPTQQSINTIIHTNRENPINQSNTSNYLQNYITSNRQSHKKQSQNPQLVALNNFQMKKHSVNETAFNYSGSNQNQHILNNLQQTQAQAAYNQQNNTNGQSSLSRGNSIKKMKTFCNGSGSSNQKQQLYQQQANIMQANSSVSGFQKQTKKVNNKGKSLNMYSTINGGTHNLTAKKRIQVKDQKIQDQDRLSDDFIKSLNEGLIETQRIDYDAVQINQRAKDKNSIKKQKLKAPKQSFLSNQEEIQKQTDNNKINNLNEIFSDFLDEQSQSHPQSNNKLKGVSKIRAESLHSRQQVLLEEDSLESTKKQPDTYQIYLQTEGQYNQQNLDSQSLMPNSSNNQLGCQRAVKHMSHKSMYALNSNQLKSNQVQKKQVPGSNCAQKQNLPQYYGTFDNSHATPFNQYTMSDCGGQFDHMTLNENYNISNINLNIQHSKNDNYKYGQRLNTEIDYINNDENQQQKEGFEGLGKRGGTMGTTNNNGYGRSDSNPARHRNNRYSDQCDDLLMLDMSEEDSILIKQRF